MPKRSNIMTFSDYMDELVNNVCTADNARAYKAAGYTREKLLAICNDGGVVLDPNRTTQLELNMARRLGDGS